MTMVSSDVFPIGGTRFVPLRVTQGPFAVGEQG